MTIAALVRDKVRQSLQQLFQQEFTEKDFQISQTKPEFEGDYTVVLFSLIKSLRKSPDELGNALGTHLINQYADTFTAYNVIKGFLNLTIAESFWFKVVEENYADNPVIERT
jgi:arginyl-tRNA synthetase